MKNQLFLSPILLALASSWQVTAASDSHLPPLMPWQGNSETLIHSDKASQTPAEATGLTATPNYDDTIAYLNKLAAQSPHISLKTIGQSAQGRDIVMVIASDNGQLGDKPSLLIQAGIHAGEIDGKDAGLMLLRDIVSGKEKGLIARANLLFIPMLSVDAHERTSVYNRVNQRGPENMGWRTNSRNLNLNRDYSKLDTKGIQAVLSVINQYQPDLYLDIHVTDGEDYQYDITYGYNRDFASQSPAIARWIGNKLSPYLDQQLTEWGHKPGRLIFGWDNKEFSKGISGWVASARYSQGYGDLRQLPSILVENHSLKPYKQRVLGTYVLIKASLAYIADERQSLAAAIATERKSRPDTQVLDWAYDKKPETITFEGINYQTYQDSITGQTEVKWLGTPRHYEQLPQYWQRIAKTTVKVPKAYIVPAQYTEVIERLRGHGIVMKPLAPSKKQTFEQLTADKVEFGKKPFEGRMRAEATFSRREVPAEVVAEAVKGAMRISTDQPLGKLATALLEPSGPDSFFAWGFFNQMFQRTEYIENYAIIPLAKKMMAEDRQLKQAFEAKLKSDKTFADDPRARLDFFYKLTPYYDTHYLQYPVLLER